MDIEYDDYYEECYDFLTVYYGDIAEVSADVPGVQKTHNLLPFYRFIAIFAMYFSGHIGAGWGVLWN